MAEDLLSRLRAHVGVRGPVQSARHPVNAPAIADWCDAMGDGNPLYLDEEAAAKSRHGGLVAPPATLAFPRRRPRRDRQCAGARPTSR